MAAKKSAQYPYQWSDGTWHSKPKAGFTPTPAPVAPAGTYDPGLDAAKRANDRGVFDLQQDTEIGNQRASTAYQTGVQQSQATRGWGLADLLRGRDRGKADLATSLARSRQDYGKNTETLQRNYGQLGLQQANRATSTGFVDSGSIAAAGAVRGANQQRDQGDLDQSQSRFEEDNASAAGRLDEDYDTGVTRTNTQADWQDAGLAADFQYGTDDRAMGLGRALRERTFFGQDTEAAKMQQATSSGLYSPPEKPKNEFSDSKGPYQVIVSHGIRYKLRPNGKREPAGVAK